MRIDAKKYTKQQLDAIDSLFERNPYRSPTLDQFTTRFQNYGDYVGAEWCGMFIGIESDGYTHSSYTDRRIHP